MNVYIIDDEICNAEMAARALRKNKEDKINIEIETNPLNAMERLEHDGDGIDLVVLDMKMPGVSGLKFLKFMQERDISIPVIVCSSYLASYVDRIDSQKVLDILDKNMLPQVTREYIAKLFSQLNSIKSCMVLSEKLSKLACGTSKNEAIDALNDAKNAIIAV